MLANTSGQSFDTIVGKFHGGEGWGKIAHDYGLNLGKVVSNARHSGNAASHAQNVHMADGKNATTVHGKSATNIGRGHTARMSTTRGVGDGSSFRSGFSGFHGGMHSMGHVGGGHR